MSNGNDTMLRKLTNRFLDMIVLEMNNEEMKGFLTVR